MVPYIELLKALNLIRERKIQILMIYCKETAFECHPIIMGRFILSVGMFQYMSDICVTYRLEDILMRKITHCVEYPRSSLQITKFTTAARFTKL